jgi:Protein of unknown function (DUF2844)
MTNFERRIPSSLLRTSVVVLALLASPSAFGVLGGDVSTVQSDRARMKAGLSISPGQGYSVHELRAPTGTLVREYVSPAGRVFAVAWQGPFVPDLRQLLGEYFDLYMQAAETSKRIARGVVHLETGDLVFESGGHMRFIVGHAYLRSQLPDGARADAIH